MTSQSEEPMIGRSLAGQALVSDQAAARLDPSGFDPSRVHICSFDDGEDYVIHVGERVYFFNFSEMFGPLFVGTKGQEIDNDKIQQSAWRAVSIWKRQGKRTAPQGVNARAIWDEPPPITHFYVKSGRSRVIVRSDTPDGCDDVFSREIFIPCDSDGSPKGGGADAVHDSAGAQHIANPEVHP